MPELTAEGARRLDEIAARHGVSSGAARTLLAALVAGRGRQAQFDHPELGGLGQWSEGGMLMVGDMFDHALKARVGALCAELAGLVAQAHLRPAPASGQAQSQSSGGAPAGLFVGAASGAWWPEELGAPSATGAQNALRYAVFPGTRRLAVEHGGRVTVYDTDDHVIAGVSQSQGGDGLLTFTSQHGPVRLSDLRAADPPPANDPAPPLKPAAADAPARPAAAAAAPPHPAPAAGDDVFAKIERLADLRRKEILSEEEYAAKKAELLARI